ncbi:HNH endonuclease [Burkholderia ubonensis]|uniref:HNH endonuclease signature motif containing protein n=1 Tax=Burkholderia ubonensis TaxID=101571 RepID=UPI00076C42D7|nr:HNH endonuclease [Burkholderia ubonensis]KVV07466.1 hypothetical protein WK77_16910 [Burkholderia ubonensis]
MLKRVLPELVISAKRKVWRMNDHAGEEADKAFQQVRRAILDACGNECAFCQHTSSMYQEVHHADDDHANNSRENLFGTCPLCHQVFHLGLAGMRDGGQMIYMPEMSQSELNQLAMLIWIIDSTHELIKAGPSPFKEASERQALERIHGSAMKLRGYLENRRAPVLMRIGAYVNANKALDFEPTLSQITPSLFANVLMQLDEETFAKRGEALGGLRLLPKPERFGERIKHWRDEANKILPVWRWNKILPEESIRELILGCVKRVDEANARLAIAE